MQQIHINCYRHAYYDIKSFLVSLWNSINFGLDLFFCSSKPNFVPKCYLVVASNLHGFNVNYKFLNIAPILKSNIKLTHYKTNNKLYKIHNIEICFLSVSVFLYLQIDFNLGQI